MVESEPPSLHCQMLEDSRKQENDEHDETLEYVSTKTNDKTERTGRISKQTLERFQSLKERADNLTKRSTEKRIKHLQKQIIETVKEKLDTDEEKSILSEHKVDLGWTTSSTEQNDTPQHSTSTVTSQRPLKEEYKQQIQQYLGINDHLKSACCNKGPQSRLESDMEEAVVRGDMKKAEQLSDKLATREFAVKITEAANAREFLKRKQEEDELIKSKKKKKLHWGFEHKQRWETKGNM